MPRPDTLPVDQSRRRRARRLLPLLLAAPLLLSAPATAVAQVNDTYVPPPEPPYVDYVYTGPGTPLGVPIQAVTAPRSNVSAAAISVESAGLGDASQTTDEVRPNLVTRSDLITLVALSVTALTGFAVSAGRFRAR